MHGDPALWQPADGTARRHGGGLAAGADRRRCPSGAALRQLGRLALAVRVHPLRAARHPGLLAGIADLGVPTICSAWAPASCSGSWALPGPDVVGVDWRVPAGRGAPAHRAWASAAGQPRPRALPGSLARRRGGHPGRPRRRGGRHRHGPRLQPRSRRAARVRPRHPGWPWRLVHAETARSHDDRRAAHGARHTRATVPRSHPSTPASAVAARRRPSSWPSWRGATTPSAACRRWPSAPRRRSMAVRAALEAREPGRYSCRSEPSAPTPSSRSPPPGWPRAGSRGHRTRPHTPWLVPGLAGIPGPRRRRARRHALRAGSAVVRPAALVSASGRARHEKHSAPASGRAKVVFTAHGCPSASARPATPTPSS